MVKWLPRVYWGIELRHGHDGWRLWGLAAPDGVRWFVGLSVRLKASEMKG